MKLKDGTELTPERVTAELAKMEADLAGPEEPKKVIKKEPAKVAEEEIEIDLSEEEEVADEEGTEVEAEAAAQGWKPGGEKSAAEFLRAGPLYDEIKTSHKEIKELRATLNELKAHMDKQQELGYQKAVEDLQKKKRAAIEYGDVDAVEALEEEIYRAKRPAAVEPTAEIPEVADFKRKHATWINEDSAEAAAIRAYSLARDSELVARKLSAKEHLEILEKDLYKKFPDRFGGRSAALAVESGSYNEVSTNRRKVKFADLNAEQKDVCRKFERLGVMTKEDYIKSLIDMGEI